MKIKVCAYGRGFPIDDIFEQLCDIERQNSRLLPIGIIVQNWAIGFRVCDRVVSVHIAGIESSYIYDKSEPDSLYWDSVAGIRFRFQLPDSIGEYADSEIISHIRQLSGLQECELLGNEDAVSGLLDCFGI